MKTIIIAGLLLLFQLELRAQSLQADQLYFRADSLMKAGDLKAATGAWKDYLKAGQKSKKGLAYSKLGACYFNLYQSDSAISYMKLAIAEKSGSNDPTDTTFLKDHAILGYIYRYEVHETRKALKHYEAERRIIESNPGLITPGQRYQNFYNLATTNRLLEDFDRALNYAYSALDASRNDPDARPHHQPNCYTVIANALNNTSRFEEAAEYYELKIASNIEQNGPQSNTLALDYYNQGINIIGLDRPDEAIAVFSKALKLTPEENESRQSSIYIGMATAHRLRGETNQAIRLLEKAIALSPAISTKRALAYRQYALLYEDSDEHDQALGKYQKAFEALAPNYKETSLQSSPEIVNLLTEPLAFEVLGYQARCWLKKYRKTDDLAALQNAYTSYQKLDKLTDSYRQNFVLESSRLYFQNRNHSNYESTIEVIYELYEASENPIYLEEAWMMIEKTKSLLLLENVLLAEKYTNLGIPDSIQENIAVASKTLLNAQKTLNGCELQKNCEQDQIISVRQTISLQEEQLRVLRKSIEVNFPEYHSFTSDNELKSLPAIKAELRSKQLMINYFAGEHYYYFVAASNKFAHLGRIEKTNGFTQNLNSFLSEISGETLQNIPLKGAFENYITSAYSLYCDLIKEQFAADQFSEWIIIPDGRLSGIPFEALISRMPENPDQTAFNTLHYLINSHQINYGFSATLWSRNLALNKRAQKLEVMAFGTSLASGNVQLAKLGAVEEEFNAIAQIKGSRLFADEGATVSNFRSNISEASMIHLALHNINDYDNPLNSQLIFNKEESLANNSLYLHEIFNMKMKPSLVVLSGCETGLGKWQQGEGTYHMGRAFLFHGNPALIMSLWRVSDASTANIMGSFYKRLSENSSSPEAIREAKLAYLQNADGITGHPRNWAAFISMGQIRAVHKKIDAWLIAITSILFLSVLIFTLQKKKARA